MAITFDAAPELQEILVADAWQTGMLGAQVDSTVTDRITVFFSADNSESFSKLALPAGAVEVSRRWVDEQDWLRCYRESVAAIEVGNTWLIDPRDPTSDQTTADFAERRRIRVPARRAFGTGGHESTRLTLRLMEGVQVEGRRVLDFGYGSGVLSFAALHAGARLCVGLESDPSAGLVGAQNRSLNTQVAAPALVVATATALRARRWIDLLLVNVRPEHWLAHLPQLSDRLADNAEILCSGFLSDELAPLIERLGSCGWAVEQSMVENEWMAVRLYSGAS